MPQDHYIADNAQADPPSDGRLADSLIEEAIFHGRFHTIRGIRINIAMDSTSARSYRNTEPKGQFWGVFRDGGRCKARSGICKL